MISHSFKFFLQFFDVFFFCFFFRFRFFCDFLNFLFCFGSRGYYLRANKVGNKKSGKQKQEKPDYCRNKAVQEVRVIYA